jgi:hypothetical protein
MAIQGLRHTANFVADQRPKNWREFIMLQWPNGTMPLTALTSLMKKDSVNDPEFYWWEKKMEGQRVEITANLTDAATELTVTSGDAWRVAAGHLLYIEQTGEIVRVSADPTVATTIPVTRGYSGTSGTAIADIDAAGVNPKALVIGTAFREGSSSPKGINYDPVKIRNYTQIFRNALEMTRTASKTRLRTGDQIKEAKREALELHGNEMERAFWFGKPWEGTESGTPIRTTGGVFHFLEAGSRDYAVPGGELDMDTLEEYMLEAFKFGSSEKMAICGNRALLTLQQAVRKNASYQFMQGQKEYGMNVSRLISPFGELVLKTHPLWNYAPGGVTTAVAYAGMDSRMAILDMSNIKYRPFVDADTKYKPDIQDNDLDGMKSEYLTEGGLEVANVETHMVITGMLAGVADT